MKITYAFALVNMVSIIHSGEEKQEDTDSYLSINQWLIIIANHVKRIDKIVYMAINIRYMYNFVFSSKFSVVTLDMLHY